MRSYFCEEEIFPNDLSRVNKSFQLFEWMRLILVNTKKVAWGTPAHQYIDHCFRLHIYKNKSQNANWKTWAELFAYNSQTYCSSYHLQLWSLAILRKQVIFIWMQTWSLTAFYSKVEETFQIIWVQMRSNISSMYMYLQMHWHLDALKRQG